MLLGAGVAALLIAALLISASRADGTEKPVRTDQPPAIDGYRHIGSLGEPTVPNEPIDVLVMPDGRKLVADIGLERIVAYDRNGEIDTDWGEDGVSPLLDLPARLALDDDGNIYVLQLTGNLVRVLDQGGHERESMTISRDDTDAAIDQAISIDFGPDGRLLVGTHDPGMIFVLNRAGEVVEQVSPGVQRLIDLAQLSDGNLAVSFSDPLDGRQGVRVIRPDGGLVSEYDLDSFAPDGQNAVIGGITEARAGELALLVDDPDPDVPPEILLIDAAGQVSARWNVDTETLPVVNSFLPAGIGASPDGDIFVPVPWEQRVHGYDPAGTPVLELAPDSYDGRFARLSTIATQNQRVFALDETLWTIQIFNLQNEVG